MDSYHSQFAYAPSADASSYMSTLRYPNMDMTPMMGPMHLPPSIDPFPPVNNGPVSVAMSAAPSAAPVSHLMPSAQIGDKTSPCFIYRHDDASSSTVEQAAHQLCTADGRIYIEHIPNHSIVYIPLSASIDQVLGDLHRMAASRTIHGSALNVHDNHAYVSTATKPHPHQKQQPQQKQKQQRQSSAHHVLPQSTKQPQSQQQQEQPKQKQQPSQPSQQSQQHQQRKPKEKSAKPINAFIKYRSYKIAELKRLHPEVSQTDISRLAGECWKTEKEDIKNQFRVQYMEEKKVYDMKKATITGSNKRQRGCSEALSEIEKQKACEEATSAPLLEDGALPSSSLNMPTDFDATRRRRSLTLPPSAGDLCARAASASPMMASQQQQQQQQPNSKRRRCVTVDLRKQLAAKSSLLATPPFAAAVPPSQMDAFVSPMIDRAHSMGLGDSFNYPNCSQSLSQDYGAIGYYGALSLAPSLANDGSSQLLDMNSSVHSNSPYLDDMGPMAPLPIAQSFSMPDAVPHSETSGLTVDTSFVSVSDAASNSAFDLYTTGSDHDGLASSLVSASLVAASLSTMMATPQNTVVAPSSLSGPLEVTTALPVAESATTIVASE
ncbi:hypothetical protein COEREDRAFT_87111 [Coemansia reversa NRRL 1564]|uniref:HMG box domain-containing protein n=1 Tax=Coemansia reversa (strain ATCC 12441 / NRRL 1564) TaxID=763665 RepID=A0A2G5BBP1_COERN|nr:hypothetical protein COEREDRAFT_87111 [Coemansia reversa NRRL 1564]|eukprot:PIA16412.1 hypothetical protein COEREDRAFT_87111 [Coemansia reversa NRRL 1564]